MRARITSIENLIAKDPNTRNIFPLIRKDHMRLAASSLVQAERVLITSGFPILRARAGETDGPPGAVALGNALKRLGKAIAYVTDRHLQELFKAIGAEPLVDYSPEILEKLEVSHLVAIERPGRARDGRYYNMSGEDITELVEPIDELFLRAQSQRVVTIGIGDGGNEVGMGRVFKRVITDVRHGEKIASTVPTDYVIVSGVSNWGAYGLIAALSVLAGQDLLPSSCEIEETLERLVRAGAVDGLSGKSETAVDGLPLGSTLELVEELRWQLTPPLQGVKGVEVGVIGAGRSGIAVARLLLQEGASVRISEKESRQIPKDLSECKWEMGGHSLEFMEGVDIIVLSPGVDPSMSLVRELRARGVPVLSELELAYQLARPTVVAITGSIGKRTTVELLGSIMEAWGNPIQVGGNKGRPLSELLLEGSRGPFALAVSSFQLESVRHFKPDIAVILNIRPFHLERHRDLIETLRIKSRIFMNQGAGDFLILNSDDPIMSPLEEKHWGETLWFSKDKPLSKGAWIWKEKILLCPDGGEVRCLGSLRHDLPAEDLMAALLAAWCLGVGLEDLEKVWEVLWQKKNC